MDILGKIFDEMPDPIKEKALTHHEAFKRLRVAEEQSKLWADELKLAQFIFQNTKQDYQFCLNRYNPSTGEVGPDPKITFGTQARF